MTKDDWNFNVKDAPLSYLTTEQITKKDGKILEVEVEVPIHLTLATKCGKVTKSRWLPKEKRWIGLSKNEEPLAWQYWPEHPVATSE